VNLDDHLVFSQFDPQNIITEIEALPDQLNAAWDVGLNLDLPPWEDIQGVVIAAMGNSAIGADLLATYLAPTCPVPVTIVRNYDLPVWAKGPQSLVICSSYSGNTEETLSVLEQAVNRGCRVLAVTTGGQLAAKAQRAEAALWIFEHPAQLGSAVGYAFGLLLAAFTHLKLIPDPSSDLSSAVAEMKIQQTTLGTDIPIMQNEAKRLAGQSIGRWLTIFGSDHLEPVARYWKIQLNELAKTWAQFEIIPEANHNTLVGVANPKEMIGHTMLLFLRARGCHPRNQLRMKITKEYFMLEGLGTDFFNAKGDTRLTQMWTALHFGDYLAYYLAMAYGVDPAAMAAVDGLKAYLAEK
jgi:glucose/mannose-6-phosphate isomerase